MDVSVLILTYNEEVNLERCFASVSWCDDIVVLDSYSTDRTESIARAAGVKFVQRTFDDYASQRNFGLSKIDYKHSWILMLDADEVVTPELKDEIDRTVKTCDASMSLFRMRRIDYFMGRTIKRSSGYPTWVGRLARVGHISVERAINEEYKTDGKIGLLQNHFWHYSFNKGFHAWFEKHNRYSTMEAQLKVEEPPTIWAFSDLWAKDPAIKRKAVKALVHKLPARPLIVFLGLYLVRGGFLEGRAGFVYSCLKSIYEFMIDCKVRELKRRKADLPL